MIEADRERFGELFEDMAIAFDVEVRPGRPRLFWEALQRFSLDVVQEAARELRTTCRRFPTISEWCEGCRAIATKRSRAAPPTREPAEPALPATWSTTANVAIVKAALRGLRVSDSAMRERALELALGELIELREEFNAPAAVPRARLTAEQDRIARVLVRELGEASATGRAS